MNPSAEELADIKALEDSGIWPGAVRHIKNYELHCCIDEAMADPDADLEHCEFDE